MPVAAALLRSPAPALAPRRATTADAPPVRTPDARPSGLLDEQKSVTPEHELRARISKLEEDQRKHTREIESLKLQLDCVMAKSAAAKARDALDAPGTPSKKQTTDRGTSPLTDVNY
jgi:hypothetical protein